MRVALTKVDGVTAVDVTLKRGVAHITLREGNRVTLAGLRTIVKDAGYTTGDAGVTAAGHVSSTGGGPLLTVEGTRELFTLEADGGSREALRGLAAQGTPVLVTGTVVLPASAAKTSGTLRIATITARK